MPRTRALPTPNRQSGPNYIQLTQFLLQPLLQYPNSLSIDCEQSNKNQLVWLRVAFESADKGRAFGRGGRNIQAIRTVLQLAASTAGQFLYLDVYEDENSKSKRDRDFNGKEERRKSRPSRLPHPGKPSLSFRGRR